MTENNVVKLVTTTDLLAGQKTNLIKMLKAALADAEAGKIDEAFIIAHVADDPHDSLCSFDMGQTETEMVFDMERAKLDLITGTGTYSFYDDEEEDPDDG